jgi:hypothetical protein
MNVNVRPILQATVIPRSIMRATVLGDVMKNFGLPDNTIAIAQRGFASGDITGITIYGLGPDGYVRDEATLTFNELRQDDQVSVDMSGGRSMVEAISLKFAHAVGYSVNAMKRAGLRLTYVYHFAPGRDDPVTITSYGLSIGNGNSYAPGTAPRQLFAISPGFDRGITYRHEIGRASCRERVS